ncbi:pre-mRNA polyadenylation factor FIP1-like [Stegodyphus dumicola]|uniref:pre-mRNA polyadenylation factor FIP1-like n=1 Tax=Stegodyphus dumicola TaxID=202533 RepID=UPI0015B1E116|nr:pre-mRNA polyadenylation factor FIP1-like [Stegodyphus dumicola]
MSFKTAAVWTVFLCISAFQIDANRRQESDFNIVNERQMQGLPTQPNMPGMDNMPTQPNMPGMPDMENVPTQPSMPGMPGLPSSRHFQSRRRARVNPTIPGMPGMPGGPDMPSFPEKPNNNTSNVTQSEIPGVVIPAHSNNVVYIRND